MSGPPPAPVSESPAELSLDQRLCLALYTASRAMTARYRVALAEFGLTYPQYLVMQLLWENSTASVGGIGQRLSLDSSTLSPLLKRLQAMGLVTRTRAADDERLMIIGLTQQGQDMRGPAARVNVDIGHATGLSPDAQLELVDSLKELTSQLDLATEQASARP